MLESILVQLKKFVKVTLNKDEECLKAAKRLLRSVINFHLGGKGLQTRRVASAMRRPR